ncbi:DsbA family oxidoreductase [Anoxybacillus rupiensis]|uniref:DsbA family oxidoreductase n=1 Tax=Anoxybacteroides rupiense TaxID=311460 RepID=A0ABD5IWU2_9BACL|nr:DsbA family oxidoreductase [Anoxybacillus rupiensis]
MKIEVWSDFVCPFCYIGKRRLEQAIEQLSYKDQIEVIFRSFELDPNAKTQDDMTIVEHLAEKYGISTEEAKRMTDNVAKQAESVGLVFRFEKMKPLNTFDAHRLAQYAKKQGKMSEMAEKLFYAYFTDSREISDHHVLAELAEAIGLKGEEVKQMLKTEQHAEEVRSDEAEAQRFGVRAVPFFVVNRQYAISGAQPTEIFVQVLQKAWGEQQSSSRKEIAPNDGAACENGSCSPRS